MASPAKTAVSSRRSAGPAILGRTASQRSEILGFREVSLLSMILAAGNVPPYNALINKRVEYKSLRQIQNETGRLIVVFPECTTSNGRGILRFADCFKGETVPTKGYNVFIMCIRSAIHSSSGEFNKINVLL